MKYALTGASGFVGRAVQSELVRHGHEVVPFVRKKGEPGIFWNLESGEVDRSRLEGVDGVIHLAGENVAGKRWSKTQKEKIFQSRVKGTSLIVNALSGLARPPAVLVSASASGIYGPAVWTPLDENAPAGTGFLADVCKAWEASLHVAPLPQTRVVTTRFGLVLGNGGILQKLLPPFRLGLGGKIGAGTQWMSWISLEDAVRVIMLALEDRSLSGAINVVSPEPVTNEAFTAMLGRALRRPAFMTVPGPALKLLFGEMADETALASSRLIPKKLLEAGFQFKDVDCEACLRRIVSE